MQQGVQKLGAGQALFILIVTIGTVTAAIAAPAISDANREKLAAPVQTLLTSSKPQRLIIQLQEPIPAGAMAQLKKAGARITRRYEFLPMVAASVPGRSIAAVAAVPGVTRVSLDGPLSTSAR